MYDDILYAIEIIFFTSISAVYLSFGYYMYTKFIKEVEDEKYIPERYREEGFGEIANTDKVKEIINRKRGERWIYPLFGDSVNYTELQEMIEENE